jgi:hypothetical protein
MVMMMMITTRLRQPGAFVQNGKLRLVVIPAQHVTISHSINPSYIYKITTTGRYNLAMASFCFSPPLNVSLQSLTLSHLTQKT